MGVGAPFFLVDFSWILIIFNCYKTKSKVPKVPKTVKQSSCSDYFPNLFKCSPSVDIASNKDVLKEKYMKICRGKRLINEITFILFSPKFKHV